MADYNRGCDVYQGFNFRKDRVSEVGFINSLKIGDKEIKADLTCKTPTDPSTDLKVSGVLSSIQWGLGVTDGLYMNAQISTANRQEVQELLYTDLTNVAVEILVSVYEYDSGSQKYFKSLHSEDTVLKGMLEKQGTEVSLNVSNGPSTEVEYPENFSMYIGVKPKEEAQTVTVQVSDTAKVAKGWGLATG
jgi:hypothetical protein